MFEGLSNTQIWLIMAGVAVVAFLAGRWGASTSSEAIERRHIAEEQAARDFARLSGTTRTEVDRLVGAGKMIEAIKLIRAELNTGLYEAKQVADLRRRSRSLG